MGRAQAYSLGSGTRHNYNLLNKTSTPVWSTITDRSLAIEKERAADLITSNQICTFEIIALHHLNVPNAACMHTGSPQDLTDTQTLF